MGQSPASPPTGGMDDMELGSWPKQTNSYIKKKTGLELVRHILKHELQTVDILWKRNSQGIDYIESKESVNLESPIKFDEEASIKQVLEKTLPHTLANPITVFDEQKQDPDKKDKQSSLLKKEGEVIKVKDEFEMEIEKALAKEEFEMEIEKSLTKVNKSMLKEVKTVSNKAKLAVKDVSPLKKAIRSEDTKIPVRENKIKMLNSKIGDPMKTIIVSQKDFELVRRLYYHAGGAGGNGKTNGKVKKIESASLKQEKLFVCHFCQYFSNRKDSLKRHMQICTRANPFVCDICSKMFTTQNFLNSHMTEHTI